MARMINADALQELCNKRIKDTWNSKTAPVSWAEAYADFKDDINSIPAFAQPGKPLTLGQLRERWKGCDSCKAACWNCSHNLLCCEDNDKECHYCFDQSRWEYNNYRNYCPGCGRPLTDEAWAELEQRLQGMPLPEPPEKG